MSAIIPDRFMPHQSAPEMPRGFSTANPVGEKVSDVAQQMIRSKSLGNVGKRDNPISRPTVVRARSEPKLSTPQKRQGPLNLTRIQNPFVEEAERVLFSNQLKIEDQLTQLKGLNLNCTLEEMKEVLFQGQSIRFDLLSFNVRSMIKAKKTLVNLFPFESIRSLNLKEQELRELTRLGINYLHAVSTHSKDVAILCKQQLIQKSQQLANSTKYPKWSENIKKEIEKFEKEKKNYSRYFYAHYFNSHFISPLTNIFNLIVVQPICFVFDFSWITKTFNVLSLGVNLRKVRLEDAILRQGRTNFRDWSQREARFEEPLPALSFEECKKQFLQEIEEASFEAILSKLKSANIATPYDIETKENLLAYIKEQDVAEAYAFFQIELNALKEQINQANGLLEKREKIAQLKIMQLKGYFDEIKPKLIKQKTKALTQAIDSLIGSFEQAPFQSAIADFKNKCKGWILLPSEVMEALKKIENHPENKGDQDYLIDQLTILKRSIGKLIDAQLQNEDAIPKILGSYIDEQETIEQSIKHSLARLVSAKHQLEKIKHKLTFIETHTQFAFTTALLAVSMGLAFIGASTLPLGGVGLIFLGLSAAGTIITAGFFIGGYLYAKKYKPHVSNLMTVSFKLKRALAHIRQSMVSYSADSKRKHLIETARVFYHLHNKVGEKGFNRLLLPDEQKAYDQAASDFKEAQEKYKQNCKELDAWKERLQKYQALVENAECEDLSQFLQMGSKNQSEVNDAIDRLQSGIKNLDFRFLFVHLSPGMRQLFEEHLGINLETLKHSIESKEEAAKETLRTYFAREGEVFLNFIKFQNKLAKTAADGS